MRSFGAGATRSRISGRIPSSAIRPSRRSSPQEQPRLLPLPAHPFETDVLRAVVSGKTPYVRFDRNQLLDSAHARPPPADAARQRHHRPPRRRRRGDRAARAQLRHRRRRSRTSRISRACSPPRARPIRRARAIACASPCPSPPRSSTRLAARGESLRAAHRPVARRCSTTTGRRNWPPPSPAPSTRDALGAGAIAHLLETRRRQRGQKPPVPLDRCPTARASAISRHPASLGDLR